MGAAKRLGESKKGAAAGSTNGTHDSRHAGTWAARGKRGYQMDAAHLKVRSRRARQQREDGGQREHTCGRTACRVKPPEARGGAQIGARVAGGPWMGCMAAAGANGGCQGGARGMEHGAAGCSDGRRKDNKRVERAGARWEREGGQNNV